jgi:hypothetical protein
VISSRKVKEEVACVPKKGFVPCVFMFHVNPAYAGPDGKGWTN